MCKWSRLSLLFLCILTLLVGGCGGGSGSSADPMGTGTIQFIDEAGGVITTASVVPNGTITLIAQVTNRRSDGTSVPVINERVTFSLVNSGNGASLAVANDRTASNGIATALFTSGNTMYSDIVRVITEVGAVATIHINKTGGTTNPRIGTLTASSTTVVSGQTSAITANVVDGASNPVTGALVRFSLPVNGSGAVFANAFADGNFYAYTDVGGNATAVYRAGSNNAGLDAFDSVLAELENGSSNAVNITRSSGTTPTPTEDLSVSLAASPTSVSDGQTSIITATVTGDEKSGEAVTFSIPVNASGASFINAAGTGVASITVTASGSGIATAIYRAGTTASGTAVQDTVRALLTNGANAAVIVTRSAGATPTPTTTYAVSVGASATSVTAGQVSVITATVTSTSGTTSGPAAGVAVTFTLPVNSSGATLSAATATTDSSGKAVMIYTPGTTTPTLTVQDTVQAAVGTATSAIVITRTGSTASAYSITVTASPATLAAVNSNSVITANVKNNAGTVVSGVTVNFAVTGGLPLGTLSAASATTDASGNAVITFTGGGAGRLTGETDVVTATINLTTYTAAVVVTYP